MNEGKWKRDNTQYVIFQCSKCKQYSYVKITQKMKKCLRCNHSHQVKRILKNGEIIKGMTAAVERVKFLQNELARKELGKNPDFISEKGFFLPQNISITPVGHSPQDINLSGQVIASDSDDYYPTFLEVLRELSTRYKKFPHYLIEILAETKGIPHSELSSLIRKAFREGYLIKKEGLYHL